MKFTIKLDSQALESSYILRFSFNPPDNRYGHESKLPFNMQARHLTDHLDSPFKVCHLNRTHSRMPENPLADYNETPAPTSKEQ